MNLSWSFHETHVQAKDRVLQCLTQADGDTLSETGMNVYFTWEDANVWQNLQGVCFLWQISKLQIWKTQQGNLLGATLSGCTSETSASLGKSPSVTAEQEEEIRRFFLQTSRDTPLLSPLLNSWFHYLLNYVLMGHLIEWQAINKFTCLKQ